MPLQEDTIGSAAGQEPAPVQALGAVLGSEWLQLPGAQLGGASIDLVLLHPQRGVALLQVAPHWIVDAPERLRHRLDQARFSAIFHGHLPVVHRMIQPGETEALPRLLAEAFAGQPGLDLPAGDAWVQVVNRALLARPKALPDQGPVAAPARSRVLRVGAGIGLAGMLATAAVLARPDPTPKPLPEPMATLAEALTAARPLLPAAASPVPEAAAILPAPIPEPMADPPPILLAAAAPEALAAMPAVAMPVAEEPAAEEPAAEAPAAVASAPVTPVTPTPDLPSPVPLTLAPTAPPAATAEVPDAPAALPEPPPLLALAIPPPPAPALPPPPAAPAPAALAPPAAPPAPLPPLALPPGRTAPRPGPELASLLRRGEALLALGDVSAARRFFERVAAAGDPAGARAMGRTHDPAVLAALGAWGIAPDPVAAAAWYRRAREMEATDLTETRR